MINYATYEFYNGDKYKGTLSESLFNSLIPKASREIDKVVNRDIKEADLSASYGDKIRFVACQLVDFLNKYDSKGGKGNLSSISIDGVTKSFSSSSKEDIRNEKQSIIDLLPQDLTRFL